MARSTFSICGSSFRYLQLAFLILLNILHIQAREPIAPDTRSCSPGLGSPLSSWACGIALSEIPHDPHPRTFSIKAKASENDEWIELPRLFSDNHARPSCMFTIELEGHSNRDETVVASWAMIRSIATSLLSFCVIDRNWGGWETLGLDRTFRALIPPNPYDQVAIVENPRGMIDSIAIPENTDGSNGFNIPLYMTITVSGPRVRKRKEGTDYAIGLAFDRYLQIAYISAMDITSRNTIARTRSSFSEAWRRGLLQYDHPRWWEFPLGPPTPEPTNVKLTCAATLGDPKPANCEAALFQFLRDGDVTLGPKHPIIRTAGNCAIGVSANTKQTTTWGILRAVAVSLLESCISNPTPFSGGIGGFTQSGPVVGRRRKRQEDEFPEGVVVSIYLQQPFEGSPAQTCAWDVASSAAHEGDVRRCPAQTGPWRPPERRLMGNGTYEIVRAGNLTEEIKGNVTYVTAGNETLTLEGSAMEEIEEEFPLIPASTRSDAVGGLETGIATSR